MGNGGRKGWEMGGKGEKGVDMGEGRKGKRGNKGVAGG